MSEKIAVVDVTEKTDVKKYTITVHDWLEPVAGQAPIEHCEAVIDGLPENIEPTTATAGQVAILTAWATLIDLLQAGQRTAEQFAEDRIRAESQSPLILPGDHDYVQPH